MRMRLVYHSSVGKGFRGLQRTSSFSSGFSSGGGAAAPPPELAAAAGAAPPPPPLGTEASLADPSAINYGSSETHGKYNNLPFQ